MTNIYDISDFYQDFINYSNLINRPIKLFKTKERYEFIKNTIPDLIECELEFYWIMGNRNGSVVYYLKKD